MSTPILATKLYIPPPRPHVVLRPRLVERLNEGVQRKLTLVSAPAGFGKTTLVSSWIGSLQSSPDDSRADAAKRHQIVNRQSLIVNRAAWLSLDEGDNDPTRFLAYFVAALQTVAAEMGEGVLAMVQSPQPAPPEAVLTALLNQIVMVAEDFVLVLDDYHVIEASPIDEALSFLIEHLPPQMHLVIVTREDPQLPLARLRARGQLCELRATDLRFTMAEAAGFLNRAMGLSLSTEEVAALEARTEGWIAGLQLAAISLQGHKDSHDFIKSFTGSHRFVMDYLVEEVLQQQSEPVQTFLLRTAILERLCGPLCEAVLLDLAVNGQETLAYLEQANLFIVPLDDERRWYRYHHLFADLLRQRLQQRVMGDDGALVTELNIRASVWYEEHGLEIEAFHHATVAGDMPRAIRLIEGKGMPLHFRGGVAPVLNWLESLSTAVLNAWPVLWTTYASVLLVTGKTSGVEPKLQAAEAALQGETLAEETQDLIGRIAAIRATLAASLRQVEMIIAQSYRALNYLHPDNLPFRTSTMWKLGFAYQLQGDRQAARQAYTDVISIGQASGNIIFTITATIGLASLQAADNQLYLAAETFEGVLKLFGERPLPVAGEAHLGLAEIYYEWNDLAAALQHGQQSKQLAQRIENRDDLVARELFLARLKLAQGDVAGAVADLERIRQVVQQDGFVHRMPKVAAMQVLMWLRQGQVEPASQLAQMYELPLSQARVSLAQGDAVAALALLGSWRQQMEAKGWQDEWLKVMVLQAVAYYVLGDKKRAVQVVGEALTLAKPGGFIRIFVDEGQPMAQLLSETAGRRLMPDYVGKLLAVFEIEAAKHQEKSYLPPVPSTQPLIEPLSPRELEILQLVAQGLSNRQISERLFLALSTVKGHNRRIFDKLQVRRRTEAVARARELGLL